MRLFKREKKSLTIPIIGNGVAFQSYDNAKYFQIYQRNPWINVCVNLRANAVSSLPMRAWIEDDIEDMEAEKVINQPNEIMSYNGLMTTIVSHIDIFGNAYLKKLRSVSGKILGLWPISPIAITPRIMGGKLSSYILTDGSELATAEIVHIKRTNPANPYLGLSPLASLARTLEIDIHAEEWQLNSFANRAIPDGVMIIEGIETQQQYDNVLQRLRDQYMSGANARTPLVLGGKARWQSISLSAAEMDFAETRKSVREQILAVYGIPQPMVGLYEYATLANIETARKIFWRDTILPMLTDIQDDINLSLGREMEVTYRYDISGIDVLQQNISAKIADAKQLWSMGVPYNKIDDKLNIGIGEIVGGDVGYVSGGIVPIELAGMSMTMDEAETLYDKSYGT